jgi:hypothetical protein
MMNRTRSTPARLEPYVSRAFHGDAAPRRPSLRGRIVRRTAGAIAAVATVGLLIPAFAGISPPSLTVSCDPTRVGVETTCRATITDTATTTDTSSLGTTSGTTKPIARGVFTRENMPAAGTPVQVATVNVSWSELEATRDVITLAPIESILDTAESRGLAGVRLRVMLGWFAPAWAKAIGDGPVPYTHCHGGVTQGTIPDLWDPNFQDEARELFAAIAARYDADPRLRLIFASGGMTRYAEPLIRGIACPENRTALLAAGYTRAGDMALQHAQLDWMRPFQRTPIGLAYFVLQYINPDGSVGTSIPDMETIMDYHIASFGDRTVLQNNSIRSSYIDAPPPFYASFRERVPGPGTTQYQTAATTRIGDADATMNWAIDYLKASGVELVGGYPDLSTDAELTYYDTALKANDPSSLQPTHAVSWSTSANGTFSGSSCSVDASGLTTCTVRYLPGAGSAGDHTITATDSGTATSAGSIGTLLTVRRRLSAATLTCATPVASGATSTCSSTVTDTSGGEASPPAGDVQVFVDGVASASCTLAAAGGAAAGCSVDVGAADGSHQVTASYGGDVDHVASASATATLTVDPPVVTEPPVTPPPPPPADTSAPTVTITSPADGAALSKGKILITAAASDDVGVTRVEFLVNGVLKCTDTTPRTWGCSWQLSNKPVDGYVLTAVAVDAAGNRSAVATANITLAS